MKSGRPPFRLPIPAGTRPTALAGGLLSALPAMAQTELSPPSVLDFSLVLPSNSDLLIMMVAMVGILMGGYGIYRVLLKGSVQKGTHPSHLQASLWVWIAFSIGLSAMVLLPTVGQGWFLLMGALLTIACVFLLIGRVAIASSVGALLLLLVIVVGLRAGNLI